MLVIFLVIKKKTTIKNSEKKMESN